MIRFLRRLEPRNAFLAVLYWVVLLSAFLALLGLVFYSLDDYLPGGGMF